MDKPHCAATHGPLQARTPCFVSFVDMLRCVYRHGCIEIKYIQTDVHEIHALTIPTHTYKYTYIYIYPEVHHQLLS